MPNINVKFPAKIVIELDAEVADYSEDTAIGALWDKARHYEKELHDIVQRGLDAWKVKTILVQCQPETDLKRVS